MLPMRLNLLPPDKQNSLQRTIVAQFVKNIFELAFFVICIVAIAFLGGQWVLQQYFHDITINTIAVSSGRTDTTVRINKVNSLLRNAQDIQKNYTLWTPILADISNVLPDDVIVTKMSLDATGNMFTIAGSAKTRDDLLALEVALEALPFVGDLEIPLSQLTKKENIAFSFETSLSL